MTKHTPGPWKLVKGSYVDNIYGANNQLIVSLETGTDDAALIGAAPDLLVACQQLENALAFALMGKPLPNTDAVIEAAQATIVKAGGWMGIDPDEPAA